VKSILKLILLKLVLLKQTLEPAGRLCRNK